MKYHDYSKNLWTEFVWNYLFVFPGKYHLSWNGRNSAPYVLELAVEAGGEL